MNIRVTTKSSQHLNPLIFVTKLSLITMLAIGIAACNKKDSATTDQQHKSTLDNKEAELSCSSLEVINYMESELKSNFDRFAKIQLQKENLDYNKVNYQDWSNRIKFNIDAIRTDKTTSSNNLQSCTARINISTPPQIWTLANTATQLNNQEECEEECGEYLLEESAKDQEYLFNADQSSISTAFSYSVERADNGGLLIGFSTSPGVSEFVQSSLVNATLLPAYQSRSAQYDKENSDNEQKTNAKLQLVRDAMNLRLQDLIKQQTDAVEKLNTVWSSTPKTYQTEQLETQTQWFKKRDVECQIEAERNWSDIPASDKEQYGIEHYSWDESMEKTDRQIRNSKCIIQRTNARIAELTAVAQDSKI